MFGQLVIFGGLIIVNAITISSGNFNCSAFNTCDNNTFLALNIVMLVLGIVAFIACIVYFIALPISVQGGMMGPANRNFNQTNFAYPSTGGMTCENGMPVFPAPQQQAAYQNIYPTNSTNY
jgi:hypothetical protein